MGNSLDQVRTILVTTPLRWQNLAQSVPADLLAEPAAPGEWSAVECLQHLIDIEHVFRFRLNAFREGRDFAAFNPDKEGTRQVSPSAQELALEFSRLREESLHLLDDITPADYPRQARHSELGLVTLEQMLNQWAAHDLNHTVQAERALMQPFIRASGPWRKYFTDHIIER